MDGEDERVEMGMMTARVLLSVGWERMLIGVGLMEIPQIRHLIFDFSRSDLPKPFHSLQNLYISSSFFFSPYNVHGRIEWINPVRSVLL